MRDGAHFLCVLFTQQDVLPRETRSKTVQGLRHRFEVELSRCKDRDISWNSTVLDLPGFSASTGQQVSNLLPTISVILNDSRQGGSRPVQMTFKNQAVMRCAYDIVQTHISQCITRRDGLGVQHALASFQTRTMRERASNAATPPYSETQAYFWIQLFHEALSSDMLRSPLPSLEKSTMLPQPLSLLQFDQFILLFDFTPIEWRRYYTPKRWHSMEARSSFMSPDLKPLPNVISMPSVRKYTQIIPDNAAGEMAAKILPSVDVHAATNQEALDSISVSSFKEGCHVCKVEDGVLASRESIPSTLTARKSKEEWKMEDEEGHQDDEDEDNEEEWVHLDIHNNTSCMV